MARLFSQTGGNVPGRSVFNLSYEKLLSCDMGSLIPVMHDEVVPGDVFQLGCELVIRMQPLVAPVLHEINAFVHYFFVPYRLVFDDWEDFITGGSDGLDATVLPRWEVTGAASDNAVDSLWDYFGFPIDVVPAGAYPLDFPKRAYNLVYNEYYRDQTLTSEVDITTSEVVLTRAWQKDYFTSALPWQQRGTSPALSISGSTSAVWDTETNNNAFNLTGDGTTTAHPFNASTKAVLEANTVDLSAATTFDVAELRLAIQTQRWLELNARAGSRYTEFLRAHFNVAPRDDRLDRPEYIGGIRTPVIVSEVLQTSETGVTPQGTLAGHGITVDRSLIGKYRATEYGVILGILSIMPRPAYQEGIDRQWLRESKYDFYFPEFANLSEQPVYEAELYASGVEAQNITVFGYQGRYNEMRSKKNLICGWMRSEAATSFEYWHLARHLGARPTLNTAFIECDPDKRIFAVPAEPGFFVHVGNMIKAVRPMPYVPNPGRMDH